MPTTSGGDGDASCHGNRGRGGGCNEMSPKLDSCTSREPVLLVRRVSAINCSEPSICQIKHSMNRTAAAQLRAVEEHEILKSHQRHELACSTFKRG